MVDTPVLGTGAKAWGFESPLGHQGEKVKNPIVTNLYAKYEAEHELAKAQIDAYFKNLVGVGEHIDFVGPVEKQLKIMAELKDLMDALENFL